MSETSSVSTLVLRWQEFREQGRLVSAEELCADCPQLLEDLKRLCFHLRFIQWLNHRPDEDMDGFASQEEVLDHIEIVAQREILIDGLDAKAGRVLWSCDLHRLAVHEDGAGIGGADARDHLDER